MDSWKLEDLEMVFPINSHLRQRLGPNEVAMASVVGHLSYEWFESRVVC